MGESEDFMGAGILCVILLLLAGQPARLGAEEADRVSVVPFRRSLDVLPDDSETLGRLFETALIRTDAFAVVKQSDLDAVLSAQEASYRDYADRDLAVAIGKVLSANRIFVGNVSKLGRTYIVSVQLVDVEKGRALKAETAEATSPEGFLEVMGSLAELFAGGKTGPSSDAAAAASDYRAGMYRRIGDRFAALRRFDGAIGQYRKALALDEFDVDTLWRIAAAMKEKMLAQSLYSADAVRTGQDAAVRDDALIRAASSADVEAILEVLYTIQAIDPLLEDDVSLLLDEAQILKMDGQAAAATALLEKARRMHPDHPTVLAELGLLLALKPPRAEGILMLRRAVALEPSMPLFHLYLGRSLQRERGNADAEAMRSYRLAAELARASDFREGRIRQFALRSLQAMFYDLGDREGGILTRELDMPAGERLELLRFLLAGGAAFDTRTPTRNPDFYLAVLCHATGRTAEADRILSGMLGGDPAKWQAFQLPWLELHEKVLAEDGRDAALLAAVRAKAASFRQKR